MVRSAATPRVSNREAIELAAILRDARKSALLRMTISIVAAVSFAAKVQILSLAPAIRISLAIWLVRLANSSRSRRAAAGSLSSTR